MNGVFGYAARQNALTRETLDRMDKPRPLAEIAWALLEQEGR